MFDFIRFQEKVTAPKIVSLSFLTSCEKFINRRVSLYERHWPDTVFWSSGSTRKSREGRRDGMKCGDAFRKVARETEAA